MSVSYLCNAFSFNMVPQSLWDAVRCNPISLEEAVFLAQEAKSVVGHEQLVPLLSELLGFEVKFNRESVTLELGDKVVLAQYSGPRLVEGSTALPDGAKLLFGVVTVGGVA